MILKPLRKYAALLVIIALFFNSTASVLASAWSVNTAQQYATNDAMMICTGSTFKWISVKDFYESGQINYIEAPADAPDNIRNVDCSYSYIAEQYTNSTYTPFSLVDFIAYQATTLDRIQRPYTSFPYSTAQTRAPPTF